MKKETMSKRSRSSSSLVELALAVMVLFGLSCQSNDAGKLPDVAAGEIERFRSYPPAAVTEALLPPIERRAEVVAFREAQEPQSRFDLQVKEAPGAAFFLGLVQDTPYSVVLHPDISGEITLSLANATLDDVLTTVQDVYGYDIQREGNRIYVMPPGLRTQIFELNYLNLERRGQSQTWISSGQISEKVGESSTDENHTIDSDDTRTFSSGSSVATANDSNIWSELVQSVASIISHGEGRSVVTNPNAGLLVVRAMPWELRDVAAYLEQMESSLNRQVILEARILEITLSDGYQAGINWAQLVDKDGFETTFSQTGGGSVFETGSSENRGNEGNLYPDATPDLAAGLLDTIDASAFGGVFSMAVQASHFTALIELLKSQGEVRTLSNPRISTVNNQKAIIKVGQDEFFVTEVSTTTVTGGSGTTTSPNITLTPFFSGIALDVTPQISRDNSVILHIHPSVSQVSDQEKTVRINNEAQTLPLALSTIRESDSIVRARSGQVVVIGGLMQDNSSELEARTPFLGDIPYLGKLFQQEKDMSRKSELVILLRPIVVGAGTWDEYAEAVSESVDSISRDSDDRSNARSFIQRSPYSRPAGFQER